VPTAHGLEQVMLSALLHQNLHMRITQAGMGGVGIIAACDMTQAFGWSTWMCVRVCICVYTCLYS
jgi:hypothetical protein